MEAFKSYLQEEKPGTLPKAAKDSIQILMGMKQKSLKSDIHVISY